MLLNCFTRKQSLAARTVIFETQIDYDWNKTNCCSEDGRLEKIAKYLCRNIECRAANKQQQGWSKSKHFMLVLTPVSLNNKNSLSAKIPIHIETMCVRGRGESQRARALPPLAHSMRERESECGEWVGAPHFISLLRGPEIFLLDFGVSAPPRDSLHLFPCCSFHRLRAAKTCEREKRVSVTLQRPIYMLKLKSVWAAQRSARRALSPTQANHECGLNWSLRRCAISVCDATALYSCCTLVSLYATLPRTIFANMRVQSQLTLKGHSVNDKCCEQQNLKWNSFLLLSTNKVLDVEYFGCLPSFWVKWIMETVDEHTDIDCLTKDSLLFTKILLSQTVLTKIWLFWCILPMN